MSTHRKASTQICWLVFQASLCMMQSLLLMVGHIPSMFSYGLSTLGAPTVASLPTPAILAAPRTCCSSMVGLFFLGVTLSSTKLRNLLKVLSISGSKGSKFEFFVSGHKPVIPEIDKREKELER